MIEIFKNLKIGDVFRHGRFVYMKIKEIVVVSGNRSTKKRNAVATYGYPMNLPGIKSTEVGDVVFFHENAEVGVEYQRQEENG